MNVIRFPNSCCSWTAMSVTGPHTLEMHSCGVENSSATGFLPSKLLNDTECMLSGGVRVVSTAVLPFTEAAVSVAIAGGREPTAGIGEEAATATWPGAPTSPVGVRVSDRIV